MKPMFDLRMLPKFLITDAIPLYAMTALGVGAFTWGTIRQSFYTYDVIWDRNQRMDDQLGEHPNVMKKASYWNQSYGRAIGHIRHWPQIWPVPFELPKYKPES